MLEHVVDGREDPVTEPYALGHGVVDAHVAAVRDGRVYTAPVPASDFGAPKWVLGLRHMANRLHPDRFRFDLAADAQAYHRFVFGRDFPPESINRSFAKPSRLWRFAEAGGQA